MKKLSKILLNTTALMTLFTLHSSAFAGTPEIKSGIYAPTSAIYSKMFHNRDSFTCLGNGAAACQSFEGKKFTPEEKELMEGGSVFGDLHIIRDEGTGEYSVSGRIYVLRLCELGTGSFAKTDDDTYEYEKKFVKCEGNDDGSINCPFVDPAETDQSDVHAVLTISPNGPKKIKISGKALPEMAENFQDGCFDEIGSTVLEYESEKDYAHNMYISSKLQFLEADGELNSTWKALSKAKRDKILPDQKKWIKEKDEKCGPVTKKGTEEKLTAMYKSQFDMTMDRVAKLITEAE